MEKILIIGGNGFVGKNLVNKLSKAGYKPIIASRNISSCIEYDQIYFDIFDYDSWKNLPQLDRVVNLAWYTMHPNFWDSQENIKYQQGQTHLFEHFAERNFRHVVVSGTCAEYLCTNETQPSNLGRAKLDCFNNLKKISDSSSLKLNWARLFFVYGQGEPQTKLLTQIQNNQVKIENIREPEAVRDFVHIDFVTDQLKFIIDNEIDDVNDIGTGYGLQVKNLFDIQNIKISTLRNYRRQPTKTEIIANTDWLKNLGIELDPEKVVSKLKNVFD